MLKSCSVCGKVHDDSKKCGRKYAKREPSRADWLRGLSAWKAKRTEIKERDRYVCQLCIRNLYMPDNGLTLTNDVQVHHIIAIEEDESMWLDDDNLICLCKYHHESAESGKIKRGVLIETAREQMEGKGIPPGFVI